MIKYHVAEPSGKNTVYTESELRDALRVKTIGNDAIFWKEGMADWKPISEFSLANKPSANNKRPILQPPPVAKQELKKKITAFPDKSEEPSKNISSAPIGQRLMYCQDCKSLLLDKGSTLKCTFCSQAYQIKNGNIVRLQKPEDAPPELIPARQKFLHCQSCGGRLHHDGDKIGCIACQTKYKEVEGELVKIERQGPKVKTFESCQKCGGTMSNSSTMTAMCIQCRREFDRATGAEIIRPNSATSIYGPSVQHGLSGRGSSFNYSNNEKAEAEGGILKFYILAGIIPLLGFIFSIYLLIQHKYLHAVIIFLFSLFMIDFWWGFWQGYAMAGGPL